MKKEGIKRQNDNMGILPGDSINHENDKIGESGDFDIFSMCKKAHFLTYVFGVRSFFHMFETINISTFNLEIITLQCEFL